MVFAACSEEIDAGLSSRQGLLDDLETWGPDVGGRHMVHRYVGASLTMPDILCVLVAPATANCTTNLVGLPC